jgi:hypothetical protein
LAQQIYQIRGRQIDHNDLETIGRVITAHWAQGRSAISRILCRQWNWYQANGRLKDRACRVLLLKLEEKGEITLPPRMRTNVRRSPKANSREYIYNDSELNGTISEFGSLTIKMVRRTPDEGLWDFFVERFHYLGHPTIVGSYLKYIACLDDQPVACLGWGSAAWKVAARDRFIGWDHPSREANLHKVVNNVRFLILPWINIRHLASKVLALNIRCLQKDWQDFYNQPISLLETFVETIRFQGTCYKAANWQYVGKTTGRGKYDRQNRATQPIKAVYLYPLSKRFREELCV